MKTRKVGRVVSVLLAIVMVVALMIPASSVLAQSGVETLDESSFPGATWQEAKDFAELKAALDNAATDGSKTYIRLTGDVEAQSFTIDKNGYYMGAIIDINGYYVPVESPVEGSNDAWQSATMGEMLAAMDSQVLTEEQAKYGKFNSALKTGGNPSFLLEHEKSGLDYFFEVFNTSDYEKYAYYMRYSPNDAEQTMVTTGKTMEDNTLIVRKNTDVVINFNGYTVSVKDGYGAGANVYTGNPNRMTSVFFVIGKLTVFGGGTITGGTGHVLGTVVCGTVYKNATTYKENWVCSRKMDDFGSSLFNHMTNHKAGEKYQLTWTTQYLYVKDATEVRGGGVYLAVGATFDMYDVKVTGNNAWYENAADGSKTNVLKTGSGTNPDSRGGGVYVSNRATFNMHSGEISNNACRSYAKAEGTNMPRARGGGVYLESGSTMNFTGGKILDNAVYSECDQDKSLEAKGGGIYVDENATLNMMGTADVTNDTNADIKNFPTVSGNSVAAYSLADAKTRKIALEGGGIYCAGTLNIRRAVVTANDFPECAVGNTLSTPDQSSVICVVRDEQTGLAEHDAFGNLVTTPNNYDITYSKNGYTAADADKRLVHAKSGKYGTGRGSSSMQIESNGAGVYIAATGKVVLGERTWIYDNYDLLTKGHKAFGDIRYCERTAADVYGGYTYTDPDKSQTTGGDSSKIDVYPGDGRTYSDTRDDIYLPEGKAFNVGESLFECKIGVNYYDMVGTGATKEEKAQKPLGANSNRVFVVSADDLDYDVWGTTSATPRPRDIQFFYLNDNNKEWEYKNYQMPSRVKSTIDGKNSGVGAFFDYPLYYSKDTSDKTIADVASSNDKKQGYAPYEGYVVYETAVSPLYIQVIPTKRSKYTGPACYERVTGSASAPLYPQVSTELSTTSEDVINNSANKAKYMDYKVIWDDDATEGFATSATQPVLRFGSTAVDRKMYVTIDFSEANKTYFALNKNESLNTNNTVDSYSSTRKEYTTVNGLTFGGVNAPAYNGSIEVGIPVPNYNIYKGDLLDKTVDGAITSITDENDNFITKANVATAKEAPDLYFKNWSFYTSYGYGPETYLPDTKADYVSKKVDANGSMLTRGTFTIDLKKINNTNLNAQPCPTLTAMWYSRDELLEARKRISNVMVQRITKKDGTKAFRFMALVGSDYADYDAAGFVYSLENATPTIEGGYKYTKATKIYKKMWTVNKLYPNGVWTEVSYLLDPKLSHPSRSHYKWNFLTSSFKDNLKMNNGYPVAGILYSDLDMTDISPEQIIYVTPYLKKGDTYYYGESRGVSYQYASAKDDAAGSTEG